LKLLSRVIYLRGKGKATFLAKPPLGTGLGLSILGTNASTDRANYVFHDIFLQTIVFKEDIT